MTSTADGSEWGGDMTVTSSWTEYWLQTYRPFERISHLIFKVASPFVLVFGIFGNFMVLLIMRRFADSSVSVFFQVLAWSDQVLLTVGLLPVWLNYVFGAPFPEDLGTPQCQVSKVIKHAAGSVSVWVLVALTMQRAASVLWPHRIGVVWTKRKSQIVAGVLVVVFTLSNSHFFFGFVFDEKRCAGYITKCCLVTDSQAHVWFQDYIFPWVHLAEFSLLPAVLLIISNTVLLRKLAASVKPDKHLPVQQASQDSRQRQRSSMTVTLLTLSASFYLLTTPLPAFFISVIYVVTPNVGNLDPVLTGHYRIFEAVSYTLWYSNSAVNFYLYCLTGKKFRTEFRNMAVGFFSLFHKTQDRSSTAASSKGADTVAGKNSVRAVTGAEF